MTGAVGAGVPYSKRFWAKVRKTDTCWLWTSAVNGDGYGQFHLDGRTQYAHRLVLELAGLSLPSGSQVDHRCHVTACVNPAHLRVVTNAENSQHRRGAYVSSRSGVRSVWWSEKAGRWVVQVTKDGRRHWGGGYASLEEAEAAAIALRCELFTHNDFDRGAAS